ncbi:MAG: hypothetical protein ABSB78_12635 [Bacteroidota bacterium]
MNIFLYASIETHEIAPTHGLASSRRSPRFARRSGLTSDFVVKDLFTI